MTHASKKTTIFILIAIFVVTMCFSLLAFSKNLYADTGYGKGYDEYWSSGTDTGKGDPGSSSSESTNTWGDPDTDAAWGGGTWSDEQTVYEENYYEYHSESSWWWYQTGVLPEDSYYNEWDETWDQTGTYDGEYIDEYSYDKTIHDVGWDKFDVPVPTKKHKAPDKAPAEVVWVRTGPMVCKQVWINEDNKFQFSFWYPYRDNNWVKIYDMSDKEVFSIDMPYDNPNIIVDLPNGMYTVKTFSVDPATPIQTFVIGKP